MIYDLRFCSAPAKNFVQTLCEVTRREKCVADASESLSFYVDEAARPQAAADIIFYVATFSRRRFFEAGAERTSIPTKFPSTSSYPPARRG